MRPAPASDSAGRPEIRIPPPDRANVLKKVGLTPGPRRFRPDPMAPPTDPAGITRWNMVITDAHMPRSPRRPRSHTGPKWNQWSYAGFPPYSTPPGESLRSERRPAMGGEEQRRPAPSIQARRTPGRRAQGELPAGSMAFDACPEPNRPLGQHKEQSTVQACAGPQKALP